MIDKGKPTTEGSEKSVNNLWYSLRIIPAIPPGHRHRIEDALKELGYHVTGGGTYTDMSECNISFYPAVTSSD